MKRSPLQRSRIPIRKVGQKRRQELAIYHKFRKAYLIRFPWCQAYCIRRGIDYRVVRDNNGVYPEVTQGGMVHWLRVPPSSEIHHVAGRTGWRLNDDTKWLAICRAEHTFIHENPGVARSLGLLE